MASQRCFPKLNGLPAEKLEHIMKNLDDETKKSLRLVNHYFLDMSRRLEKAFLKFFMFSEISADRLILMSDQVQTVQGLETDCLTGDSSAVDESIQYLIQHHPELESFKIGSRGNISSCSNFSLQALSASSIQYLIQHHPELESVKNKRSSCSDSSLQALFSHPNIRIIKLRYCPLITGEILYTDSEVKPKLKVLDLGGCRKLTDIGVVGLLNLTDGETLTELDLQDTNITLDNISDLNIRLPKLEKLSLGECFNITDAVISLLNTVGGELKHLDLSETFITLDNIGDLNTTLLKLEYLDLGCCDNITDTGTISLLNMVGGELKHLDHSDSNITLDNIGDLNTTLLKLEYLGLGGCFYIKDTGTISLLNRVGGELRVLDLSDTNITLDNSKDLNTTLRNLEHLLLASCAKITDTGTISLLNRVGCDLKHLDLSKTLITLDNIGDLNTTVLKLEYLLLASCAKITDTGTISLLNRVGCELKLLDLSKTLITLDNIGDLNTTLLKLEYLGLDGCANITDTGTISLLNRVGGELKHLDLGHTNITMANIGDLNARFPKLERICLEECPNITEADVISLLNKVGNGVTLSIGGTPVSAANIRHQFPSLTISDEIVDDESDDDSNDDSDDD